MAGIPITIVRQAGTAAPSPAAQARADVRAQVQQTIHDANLAAQDAASEAARAANQDAPHPGGDIRISTSDGKVITIPHGAIPGFPVIGGGNSGPFDHIIPPQVEHIALGFFIMCAVMVVGWPISRAFGRRIDRGQPTPAVPPAVADQLLRIEQAVDAMAIEVERISESQRFMARLQQGSTAERV